MGAPMKETDRLQDDLDIRDAIIHVLYLKLVAERETREAIIDAARSGAAPEVLEAIASDPVPVIDEFGQQETVRKLLHQFSKMKSRSSGKKIGPGR